MNSPTHYSIHLDPAYGYLELVDGPALIEACEEKWSNQTLCEVNDSVIRLGILEGEFHWHKHDQEDEFFFVLEGQFLIDLEEKSVSLDRYQAVPGRREEARRALGLRAGAIAVTTVANVRPEKGHETLLQALGPILARRCTLRLRPRRRRASCRGTGRSPDRREPSTVWMVS